MPKRAAEYSPLRVRRLSAAGNYFVGGVSGLMLRVAPSGAKQWLLRLQRDGQRREFGLGGYPNVSLEKARTEARAIREQWLSGLDPAAERRAAAAANAAAASRRKTYEEVAREWHQSFAPAFRSRKHSAQWLSTQETYVFPVFGDVAVDQIDTALVRQVLEPIWNSKPETASRVRGRIQKVLDYAKSCGYRTGDNPANWANNVKFILPPITRIRSVKHHPAMPVAEVAAFMQRLRSSDTVTSRALEFLVLTATRNREVRLAAPSEFDLENGLWTIPPERMKAKRAHKVPLCERAMAILRAADMKGPYVFPGSAAGKPLSENTLGKLMRTLDVPYVPHGFRSTFKDWARSHTSYADEISELALAHVNGDATRAAYARDDLLGIRRRLLRDWERHCASSHPMDGNVIPIKAAQGMPP